MIMFVGFNLCTLVFLGHTSPCIPFSSRLFFRSFSSEPVHPLSSSPHLQHPWWSISSLTSSWTGITSRPHGNRTCQTFGKPKSIPASTIWGQLSQPISGNNRIWLSLGLPHYIPKVHSKFRPVLTCAFGTVFSPSPMRKNENKAF